MADIPALLRTLARVAPGRAERVDVATAEFAWLGTHAWPHSAVGEPDPLSAPDVPTSLIVPGLRPLALLDASHGAVPMLRLGWCYLVGSVPTPGGEPRRALVPLVERPVTLGAPSRVRTAVRRGLTGTGAKDGEHALRAVGPWDLASEIVDPVVADDLEESIEFGGGGLIGADEASAAGLVKRMPGLTAWVEKVTSAMGIPRVDIVGPTDPRTLRDVDRPTVVVGFGLHPAMDLGRLDLRTGLAAWAAAIDRPTALDAVYLPAAIVRSAAEDHRGQGSQGAEGVESAVVLTVAQENVVERARHEPLVVVSGPPGTGKTHTAVAVALDAVARGERVLVATRSAEAAEVVAGHLARAGGPEAVMFGGGVRARRLAARLADGLEAPPASTVTRLDASREAYRGASSAVDRALVGLDAWRRYDRVRAEVSAHAASAPDWFEAAADLDDAERRLGRAERWSGPWSGWARRRAVSHAGAARSAGVDRLREALDVAVTRRLAVTAVPTVAEARWADLDDSEASLRREWARSLDEKVRSRGSAETARAVGALAAALRGGRAHRRRLLRAVDADALTWALPLWVGTLGDIEELLPTRPAMFDLVVLDEASQIDQPAAVVALARARRAVVVGDPQQLRFVSFVPEADVQEAIAAEGTESLADRLDVRRVSAFDAAAASAPITMLDEHFRGPPALIEFSARRFYRGRLTAATQHPSHEGDGAVEVRVVEGRRSAKGVNEVERDEVLALLRMHRDQDWPGPVETIGVVTPFRSQADAIWEKAVNYWGIDDVERFRCRVGTVHAFQGDERDVMILSLAIGPDGDGLRFVEDPNLFNVMVTRARKRLIVVTSCPEPRPGLLRDYLSYVESTRVGPGGPGSSRGTGGSVSERPSDGWTASVLQALEAGGVAARPRYRVGREEVDLVVGRGAAAVGVETTLHPDGPAAHRRRHLALRRSGWRLVDAFPARFDGDPVPAAVELATTVGQPLDP